MAWTAPQTWTTGQIVTASDMNTDVRDNMLVSAVAQVTTAGDIVYATAANVLARLAIGTFGQFLGPNSGATAPEWTNTLAATTFVADNARFVTGHTAAITTLAVVPSLQVLGTDYEGSTLVLGSWSLNDGGQIHFIRSRDPVIQDGSFATVNDNDIVGKMRFLVDDGVDIDTEIAYFEVRVDDGSPAAGDIGAEFNWHLMPGGGLGAIRHVMRLSASGVLYVGDAADVNANMAVGVTISQGAADDEILAFKSSDVAHGMTDLAETDTYGFFRKQAATTGGVLARAFGEDERAWIFTAFYTNSNTTKSGAGQAPFEFDAQKKTGTTAGAMGADDNLALFSNSGTAVWILDEDGDTWQSGGIHVDVGALIHQDSGASGAPFRFTEGVRIEDSANNVNALEFGKPDAGTSEIAFSFASNSNYHNIAAFGPSHGSVASQLFIRVAGTNIAKFTSSTLTFAGDFNPATDDTYDLGIQTTAEWANVWSTLINGAEIGMKNKWRMMESELYPGYPVGWAVGYDPEWVSGKSIWSGAQEIGDSKPVFVVTDEFLEYNGRRFTPEMMDRLLELAEV